MFVPRYPDSVSDVESGAVGGSNNSKKNDGTSRSRIHSEDVTVSTDHSTPPATPGPYSDATSDDDTIAIRDRLNSRDFLLPNDEMTGTRDRLNSKDRLLSDWDASSIKGKIPAISEEVEEGEDSRGDESNSPMLADPTPDTNILVPNTKINLTGDHPPPSEQSESTLADDTVIHC